MSIQYIKGRISYSIKNKNATYPFQGAAVFPTEGQYYAFPQSDTAGIR